MAVETYGVTQSHVESYFGQLKVTSVAPVAPADFTEMVEGAAARVNARLIAAFGSGTPASIAADATTVAYRNCQRIIVAVVAPDILFSQHHTAVIDEYVRLKELGEEALGEIKADPVGATGYTDDETLSPGVWSSVHSLSLDTTTAKSRERRSPWSGTSSTKDEGQFVW